LTLMTFPRRMAALPRLLNPVVMPVMRRLPPAAVLHLSGEVHGNDTVEIGQTRAQAQRQSELVGQRYRRGYINDDGDWQPEAFNPATNQWQDIKPGDVVIQGGSVTQVADGTFTHSRLFLE
jgi:hypothetical protein